MSYLIKPTDWSKITTAQRRKIAERWGIDPDADNLAALILNSPKNRTETGSPLDERHEFFRSIGSRNYLLTGRA